MINGLRNRRRGWKPLRVTAWGVTLGSALVFAFACIASAAETERLPNELLKNGEAVRGAFRDSIARAHRWTVEIRMDGQPVALGTVVDSDGWILTKASQLNSQAVCRFSDGRELPARLVGIDYDYDLALLKVDARDLPAVEWSVDGDPAVGRWVATSGLDEVPIAVGIVGAGRRAIPRERGFLGIAVTQDEAGLVVDSIQANSGADQAGLEVDDVLESINGRPLGSYAELTKSLRRFQPGDIVALSLRRNDNRMDLLVTLGEAFANFFERSGIQNRLGGELSRRRTGFRPVLQHDSLLKPAACGGSVVDLNGRAVGVNVARAGRTETYVAPAAEILPLLAKMKSGKKPAPKEWARRVAEPPVVLPAEPVIVQPVQ